MKKISRFAALTLFLTGLLVPGISFATSGACSWHGGVDCSAGPAADGGAICYDGSESSVPYSLMVECNEPTVSVPQCTTQSDYDAFAALCSQAKAANQSYCAQEATFAARYGGTPPSCSFPEPLSCTDADICLTELKQYTAAQQQFQYQSCASKGPDWHQVANDPTQCILVCQPGYDAVNGACQINMQGCRNTLGYNSHPTSSSKCSCDDGYTFDMTLIRCVPIPQPTNQESTTTQVQVLEPTETVTSSVQTAAQPKKAKPIHVILPPSSPATTTPITATATDTVKNPSRAPSIWQRTRNFLKRIL